MDGERAGQMEAQIRELGFDGVIVTDAMEMGAITRQFPVEKACVEAIKAGADALLCVRDYRSAVKEIEDAVLSGDIPESRIDESVTRLQALRRAR